MDDVNFAGVRDGRWSDYEAAGVVAAALHDAYAALRELERRPPTDPLEVELEARAKDAIAMLAAAPVTLEGTARDKVAQAFRAMRDARGREATLAMLNERGLDYPDAQAAHDGKGITLNVAADLVLVAVRMRGLLSSDAKPVDDCPPFDPPPPEEPPAGPDEDDLDPPANFGAAVIEDDEELTDNPYFRVLGFASKRVVIHQLESGAIESYGVGDLNDGSLIGMSDLNWLEREFPIGGTRSGFNKKMAANQIVRKARRHGIFDPSVARGRGAWIDGDRVIYHMGNQLWVDGQLIDPIRIQSEFIYPCGIRIPPPAAEVLQAADGKRILDTLKLFAWTNPTSAILLAGWIVLAPIGGALRWRPHVWITGGTGSGKSELQSLLEWLLGGRGAVHFADGNSTEAGIRQSLKADAIPVLFDESEQNDERETQRVQHVLALMRQSSTENSAVVLKGTATGEAMRFMMRSMFCLSSVQVGIKQQADRERITKLNLKPKSKFTAESKELFGEGLAALKVDEDIPARLLRRTLDLLPTIRQNVRVFVRAATERFGSPRYGDQYGTLLAGAWSLQSGRVATAEQARAAIARLDWSGYLEGSETDESERALNTLLGKTIRIDFTDFGVGELAQRVADPDHSDCNADVKDADDALRRHGIWVRPKDGDGVMLVANNHVGLDELIEGTPFAADLRGQLLRLEGVEPHHEALYFKGVKSRSVRVPLHYVLDRPKAAEAWQPNADEDTFDEEIAF